MGTSLSRQNAAVEEADVSLSHPYKYPPRTGTKLKINAMRTSECVHKRGLIFTKCS